MWWTHACYYWLLVSCGADVKTDVVVVVVLLTAGDE